MYTYKYTSEKLGYNNVWLQTM